MRPRWPRCGKPFYSSRDELGEGAWRVCERALGHLRGGHRGPLVDPPEHDPMALLQADELPHVWRGKHRGEQM